MRGARIFAAAAVVTGFILIAASGSPVAAGENAAACAALTFRPVPPGLTDGDQDAGVYKSRFGRIALRATVKNSAPLTYFVEINGRPPAALAGAPPESVEACAKAKRLGRVGSPPASCIGDRFALLIDHTGEQRYFLLYAHRRGEWRFCSIGTT